MSALGMSFVLEGLFGEADVEAIDAKPDSELVAGSMGMDIEDNTADSRMIIDVDAPTNWFELAARSARQI